MRTFIEERITPRGRLRYPGRATPTGLDGQSTASDLQHTSRSHDLPLHCPIPSQAPHQLPPQEGHLPLSPQPPVLLLAPLQLLLRLLPEPISYRHCRAQVRLEEGQILHLTLRGETRGGKCAGTVWWSRLKCLEYAGEDEDGVW